MKLSSLVDKLTPDLGEWTLTDSDGNNVVEFTSFISLDAKIEHNVVSSAIEEGSFATYNKVAKPLQIRITLAVEGNDDEIGTAIDKLYNLSNSTKLLSISSPDVEYNNLNIESVSYIRKTDDGLGVIFFEIKLVEVQEVKAEYTNVKVGGRKDGGKVQPKKETSFAAGAGDKLRGWFGGGK